jgi:hypothetical protein
MRTQVKIFGKRSSRKEPAELASPQLGEQTAQPQPSELIDHEPDRVGAIGVASNDVTSSAAIKDVGTD